MGYSFHFNNGSLSVKEDSQQPDYLPLDTMIALVQMYIYHAKHVVVKIVPPRNDKELQLLGKAYDCAERFFLSNPQFGI